MQTVKNLVLVVILLGGVLGATMVLAVDARSEAEIELHAFNDRFNALTASYDIDGLVELYSEDALWIAPKSTPIPGRKGAGATFGFMQAKQGTNVHSVDKLVISEDGSLAVMTGTAHIVVESAGLDFTGTYQFVLRRNEADWEIVSDMYNMHEEVAVE